MRNAARFFLTTSPESSAFARVTSSNTFSAIAMGTDAAAMTSSGRTPDSWKSPVGGIAQTGRAMCGLALKVLDLNGASQESLGQFRGAVNA